MRPRTIRLNVARARDERTSSAWPLVVPVVMAVLIVASPARAQGQAAAFDRRAAIGSQAPAEPATESSSPWLVAPLVSSNPKLGTSFGALGAYATTFDPKSRVSLFGAMAQYTSTDSTIAGAFVRASFGADHHRLVALAAFGNIKNDYQDYLGSGQPLQTIDTLHAAAARYLVRVPGNWLVGAQANAANYQVLGASADDDLVLETLGIRGFESVAAGAVVMHDSRDNEDMPSQGWYVNLNNLAYREALGGASSFDAYRADVKVFVPEAAAHALALRQFNWFTHDAPAAGQATVVLRGYKLGQYLAPYMSSLEAEERLSFGRFGATVFAGVAQLYGAGPTPLERQTYPTWGAGFQFVLKPDKHLLANVEYAQGVEDNHGFYVKFGYGW